MLDNLVESKNHQNDNKNVRKLFLTTSTITVSGVIFALVFSLFSQTLAMGTNDIEITTLLSPVKIPENKPQPPEPVKNSEKSKNNDSKADLPTRKVNMLRLDESPKKVPNKISSTPNNSKSRPLGKFKPGVKDIDPNIKNSMPDRTNNKSSEIGPGFSDKSTNNQPIEKEKSKVEKETPKTPPPAPIATVVKQEKPKDITISGGVINGKATKLVKPNYPASAKSIQLRGQVTVQVLIDENGKVISAQAVNGHKLFYTNAVSAARQSVFTPTTLSGQKVKVNGLIVYNFN